MSKEKLVEALKEFFINPLQAPSLDTAVAKTGDKTADKAVDTAVDVAVNAIYINYQAFLLLCILDEGVKKEAEKDPKAALKKYVPCMKIPENAVVVLDPNDRKWPTVVFEKVMAEKYEYEEFTESANVVKHSYFKSGKLSDANIAPSFNTHKTECRERRLEARMDKKECSRTTIKLPFFIPETDVLTEYRFKDQDADKPEIILTTC